MHELLGGAGVAGQHHVLLDEVDFDVEFVERHPVLEVAVEPVGLLDQHRPAGERPLRKATISPNGAPGLLGGLDVHELAQDGEAVVRRVLPEQLQLRRDREALLLLLLGGDAGIEDSLHRALDVVFREDESRHHTSSSGENLSLLRRLAISLLKQEQTSKASLKTKRLRCG